MNGKFKCNECDQEWEIKVNINLLNTENLTDLEIAGSMEEETEEEEKISEGEEINEQINSSPDAMPPVHFDDRALLRRIADIMRPLMRQ